MANLLHEVMMHTSTYRTMYALKTDAESIKTSILGVYKNTTVNIDQMKRNNKQIRSVFQWIGHKLNHKEAEDDQSPLREDEDDFDPGFQFDNEDEEEKSSEMLTPDLMRSQMNASSFEMLKIAKHKLDAKIHTTAEIMTVVNNRSAEIIASLQTTNTVTKQISEKLDLIIKGLSSYESSSYKRQQSTIVDSSGYISRDAIVRYIKDNQAKVTKDFTDAMLDTTGLREIDNAVNTTIQSFQHNMLQKLLDIPFLRDNMRYGGYAQDYSRYVSSAYDKSPATFDNMTRKTIVDIIPAYLRQITYGLTNVRLNISDSGEFTTEKIENDFVRSIDYTFDISKLDERRTNELVNDIQSSVDADISSADIKEVLRVMVEQYVASVYRDPHAKHVFSPDKLKNGGDRALYVHIAKLFAQAKDKPYDYWMRIIGKISSRFMVDKRYRNQFATSITAALYALDAHAKYSIENARVITDTSFTEEMFDERALLRLKSDSSSYEYEGKTLRQLIKEGIIKKETLSTDQLSNLDERIKGFAELQSIVTASSFEAAENSISEVEQAKNALVKSIFDLLNTGINVHFIEDMTEPFQPMHRKRTSTKPKQTPKQSKKIKEQSTQHASVEKPSEEVDDEIVDETAAMLKTGTMTQDMISSMQTQVSSIKDTRTQQTMKRIVTSAADRSSEKKAPKTRIGKALFAILTAGATFFKNIFTGFKTFIMERVFHISKHIKSSFEKIKYGGQSVKEGLFGSDESYGIFGRIKNKITEKKENKQKKTELTPSSPDANAQTINESTQQSSFRSKVSSKLNDILSKSEFGKGIMSAHNKRLASKLTVATSSDHDAAKIESILSSSMPEQSVVYSIVDALDWVKTTAQSWFDKIKQHIADRNKSKDEENKTDQKDQHTLAFDIGKVVGGMMGVLGGILQAALTVITSMAAFKKIIQLGHNILKNSLQPLNKTFQLLYKRLKPAAESIQHSLKQIVSFIADVAKSFIEYIQPLLDAIGPIIEEVMETLKPILDSIKEMISVLLVPMTAILQTVVVPILITISNILQSHIGFLQVALGTIITIIGGIMVAVGGIGKLFKSSDMYDTGKRIMETGENMVKSGATTWFTAMKRQVGYASQVLTDLNDPQTKNMSDETPQQTQMKARVVDALNGSPMEGVYGSGDADMPYKFDDDVLDALENLKTISSGIFGLFNGDNSLDVEAALQSEKEKLGYQKAKADTSDLSDEDKKKIDDRGFEIFKSEVNNEQLYGETDEEYYARYEKQKDVYWTKAAKEILYEKAKANAGGTDDSVNSYINDALSLADGEFEKSLEDYNNNIEKGSALKSFAEILSYALEDDDEYYDDDGYYYEGGTGDIFQAAAEVFTATRKAVGSDLRWNGTSAFNITFDDGMVIDKISPTHCTSMMTAIVKRMGYYVPGTSPYTDTYQGTDQLLATAGGHGSMSWGLQSNDGHPNIYDRDGNVSEDWITGVGNPQPGDITFGGIGGNIHAHMGAYQGANGYWFGFNGGRDDSLKNSVRLGEYYLQHGTMPPSSTVGYQQEGNRYDQQLGALAPPMQYWVRYVGPKSKGKRRKVKSSSSDGEISITNTTKTKTVRQKGTKLDWIKTVAMMFEGYYFNGGIPDNQLYDNGRQPHSTPYGIHEFKIRDGRTVKARTDCSGMLGAAMTAFGYDLTYPPSSTHYNVAGYTSASEGKASGSYLDFITENGKQSKDWKFYYAKDTIPQPGDIMGKEGHASFPVVINGSSATGMDSGGHGNIKQSAQGARDFLDGKKNPAWYWAMMPPEAKYIIRYVGDGSKLITSSTKKKKKKKKKKSSNLNVNNTSSKLTGSSTEEKIFNYLTRTKGISGKGAAGMMGCMKYESGMRSNNLEDSYNARWGVSDETYTQMVNNKRESKNQFVYGRYDKYMSGQTAGEAVGYGLTQFTSSNLKRELYDATVSRGKSIDDIGAQLDAVVKTLNSSRVGSQSLLQTISQAKTPTEANQWFLWRYEAGTGYNSDQAVANAYSWMGMSGINDRHNAAEQYYRMYGSGDAGYTESVMTMPETFDPTPIMSFAMDDSNFGGYGDDFVVYDQTENIPYEIPNEPLIIPELPQNVDFGECLPCDSQMTIVNKFTMINALQPLTEYLDQIVTNEMQVHSDTIGALVSEISEELPEYLDYYFSDEDDALIYQLTSNFE